MSKKTNIDEAIKILKYAVKKGITANQACLDKEKKRNCIANMNLHINARLEAGTITEIGEREDGPNLWQYTVATNEGERKNVRSFSRVKYEVGRWVVIHRGETGWYVIPSSSLYYKNA